MTLTLPKPLSSYDSNNEAQTRSLLEQRIAFLERKITNLVPLSYVPLSGSRDLATADAEAAANGISVWIDEDVTLSADMVFSAVWEGHGGVITLGNFNLTGRFTAPPDVQMFNISGSGRVIGVAGGTEVYTKWFGLVNSTPDAGLLVNAAITYARVNTSGPGNKRIFVNPGTYVQETQIVTYDGVSITSTAPEATTFVAGSAFTNLTTSGAWRIGDGSAQIYGTLISNITIDINNFANGIACYTSDAQDGTGFQHMILKNVQGHGVWFDGAGSSVGFCNNYICDDIYVEKGTTGGVGGVAFQWNNGTLPGTATNLTVVVLSLANTFSKAYYMHDIAFVGSSFTLDGSSAATCIDVGANNFYVDITGVTALANTATGINIAATNAPVNIKSIFYIGGGNAIVDAGGGTAGAMTVSGNYIGDYERGQNKIINCAAIRLPNLSSSAGSAGTLYEVAGVLNVS